MRRITDVHLDQVEMTNEAHTICPGYAIRHDWARTIRRGDFLAFPYMTSGPLPYPFLNFDQVAEEPEFRRDRVYLTSATGRRMDLHPSQIVRIVSAA